MVGFLNFIYKITKYVILVTKHQTCTVKPFNFAYFKTEYSGQYVILLIFYFLPYLNLTNTHNIIETINQPFSIAISENHKIKAE